MFFKTGSDKFEAQLQLILDIAFLAIAKKNEVHRIVIHIPMSYDKHIYKSVV